ELFADFAQISNISFGNVLVDTVACNKIIERSTGQGVQIAGGLIINGIAFFNGINLPNLPTQHYIGIDNDGYITHAINSPNLASIDQNLSSNSNVQFAGIKTTDNIYLNGDKLVQFRHDFPNNTHYGIHWRSTSWDLRIILDKDTVSARGVSFGHYEDNDMNKTWNEYVKIKNNGTI